MATEARAAGQHSGFVRVVSGRIHRQRCSAGDFARSGRRVDRPAVGRECVSPDTWVAHAPGRIPSGHVWARSDSDHRPDRIRRGVDVVRGCAERRISRGHAGVSGCRRCASRASLPRSDDGELLRRRGGIGHRHVDVLDGRRGGDRSVARRISGGCHLVAVYLRHQRVAYWARSLADAPAGAGTARERAACRGWDRSAPGCARSAGRSCTPSSSSPIGVGRAR